MQVQKIGINYNQTNKTKASDSANTCLTPNIVVFGTYRNIPSKTNELLRKADSIYRGKVEDVYKHLEILKTSMQSGSSSVEILPLKILWNIQTKGLYRNEKITFFSDFGRDAVTEIKTPQFTYTIDYHDITRIDKDGNKCLATDNLSLIGDVNNLLHEFINSK